MSFSTDESRWPYMAVLVWIATRCFRRTNEEGLRSLAWVDRNLAIHRSYVTASPPGDSVSNAKLELSDKLAQGALRGVATKLTRHRRRVSSYGDFKLQSERVETACAFPPSDDPALLRGLLDAQDVNADAILYEPLSGDEPHTVDWRELTFAREDVLRLWPEYPQVVAHRLAKAARWTAPKGLDAASLATLPEGKRIPLAPAVNLLAFGSGGAPSGLTEVEAIAARMRATYALLTAARDELIELWGTPALRRSHPLNPLEAAGLRQRIEAAEFDNDALALSHQYESALGAEGIAANYATHGMAPDGVKWFGVTIDRASFEKWLATIGRPTLEAVLREAANRNAGNLTQKEAVAAAKAGGVFVSRERTIEAMKPLGIEGKQGRRKKPADAG